MISALLVSLLVPGAGAPLPAAAGDDPPIQLWINRDRRFERGDRGKVHVRTEDDGYIVVLHADPDGRLRVLFPLDPGDDNFVRGGKKHEVEGRGGREAFQVHESNGQGTVYAAVSRDPLRFDEFVRGDHWDYKVLGSYAIDDRDAEPELTELVRRMAPGGFEYDLLTYDVYRYNVAHGGSYYGGPFYPDHYYYTGYCHRFSSYDPFCDPLYYGGRPGFGLAFSFGYGRPFRRHYFDAYRYGHGYGYGYGYGSPYDPYYYDPYFYGRHPFYDPWYYRNGLSYPYSYTYWGDYGRPIYTGGPRSPYRRRSVGVSPFDDRNYAFGRRGLTNIGHSPASSEADRVVDGSPRRRTLGDGAANSPLGGDRGGSSTGEPRRRGERGAGPEMIHSIDRRSDPSDVPARRSPPGEATSSPAPRRDVEPAQRDPQREAEPQRRDEPRPEAPRQEPRSEPRAEPRPERRQEPRRAPEPRHEPQRAAEPRSEPQRAPERRAEPPSRSDGGGFDRGSGGSDGGSSRPSSGGSSRRPAR